MEINSRPLNQDKADRLRRWLHQPEFILLLEQLEYRKILAEQAIIEKMLQCQAKPLAVDEAKEKAFEANRFQFMIDQLNELAGTSDVPGQTIESELIVVELEMINHVIDLRTKQYASTNQA